MSNETKYQIFLSSTYKDLKNERKALIQQTLDEGHIPSGMEMFSAGDEEDLKVIHRAIDQCDIYVILVGYRFGSIKDDKSFTQIEFNYAREAGKPILAFLLDEGDLKRERDNLKKTKNPDKKFDKQLKNFRVEVTEIDKKKHQHRLVRTFKKGNPSELKALFSIALNSLIKQQDNKIHGWIKANEELLSLGLVSGNPFIREIIERLKKYDVLTERSIENVKLKKGMASYFLDQCFAPIMDLGVRDFFFESGSTIAYLSSEFSERLSDPAGQNVMNQLSIKTNNILTYLEFVLTKNIKIILRPSGTPENKYGATFGDLTLLLEYKNPPDPDPVTSYVKDAINKMAKHIKENGNQLILFGTASAININQSKFPIGPHGGSYYNKLFKRALLKTNCPLVLFVDSTKFDIPFKESHCFSICDSDMKWEQVCKTVPLALCVGCKTNKKRVEIIEQLKKYGFTFINPVDSSKNYDCFPLLVSNKLFYDFISKEPK